MREIDPRDPGDLGRVERTARRSTFRGDFYTHTLMTPFFTPPGPTRRVGPPKIFLAGVGELMTEVAGEVCDGLPLPRLHDRAYLREVTLPALERGRAKAGKTMEGFEIVRPALRGHRHRPRRRWPGRRRHARSRSRSTARRPPTAVCSSCTGWGGLQDELNALSKQGKWVEMGKLIDDEVLNTFAVVGEPEQRRRRAASPLRRRHQPDQLLRPVHERPRPLEPRPRRPQGCVITSFDARPVSQRRTFSPRCSTS